MNLAVWDTYITKKDGSIMHFDIIVPSTLKNTNVIFNYGKEYLKTKGLENLNLSSKECVFCHVETLKPAWENIIKDKGYFIYEMENCN